MPYNRCNRSILPTVSTAAGPSHARLLQCLFNDRRTRTEVKTTPMTPMIQSDVPGHTPYRGKVRDVYDLGERLVLVATDRISAFDHVMSDGIPGKGVLLTTLTNFWLDRLLPANHRISCDLDDLPEEFQAQRQLLEGRTMLVRKTEVIPIECVARGYLIGSGWEDYKRTGSVCGNELPKGLKQAEKLPQAIFTPATKAAQGEHDQNITFDEMVKKVGVETAEELRRRTLEMYHAAAEYAAERGIILADAKFEFGKLSDGEIILIDEVLTPDSSRYWPAESVVVGMSPPSFDKQYLRDWLDNSGWDKASPPPFLPKHVMTETAKKYAEALARLTA